jgi:hypothetical protein
MLHISYISVIELEMFDHPVADIYQIECFEVEEHKERLFDLGWTSVYLKELLD